MREVKRKREGKEGKTGNEAEVEANRGTGSFSMVDERCCIWVTFKLPAFYDVSANDVSLFLIAICSLFTSFTVVVNSLLTSSAIVSPSTTNFNPPPTNNRQHRHFHPIHFRFTSDPELS